MEREVNAMFGRSINPVVLFVALTVGALAVVFWATWSALPHHEAAASASTATKVLPVELLGVLSWGISGVYGVWLAATGRKIRNVPRRLAGRGLRVVGTGEAVLSMLAIWAILAQPANTFLYSFVVLVGILTLAIAIPLAVRDGRTGVSPAPKS
jgi:hypothetical protein